MITWSTNQTGGGLEFMHADFNLEYIYDIEFEFPDYRNHIIIIIPKDIRHSLI